MDKDTKDCEELSKAPALLGARLKAYRYIYLKNRKKYPLPFIDYEIVFEDGDKRNLRSWNIKLMTSEEILALEANTLPKLDNNAIEENVSKLGSKILRIVKAEDSTGGVFAEKISLRLKESPTLINAEINKLLEDGMVYEPRPGKLRYLG